MNNKNTDKHMKAKEIQELISFIADSGLDEVNIETDEFKIKVKRHADQVRFIEKTTINPQQVIAPQTVSAPVVTPTPVAEPQSPAKVEKTSAPSTDTSKYIAVKSPMIGTFYRASSPDKPPFASVGDEIKPGQVVCIIEAMKLFNEIESEVSGRIVKVLVDNASPVEYDQELFLIDPS